MRVMFDSTTPSRSIPASAAFIAAYIDGRETSGNYAEVVQHFPHAQVVKITVTGTAGAHVADIEAGDMTPTSGAAWAKRELMAHRQPTLYCNLDTWPAVKAEVEKLGITVNYWIAQYDGKAVIPAGAVAKQYRSDTAQNLDYSVVAAFWPGVDPPMKAQAVAAPVPAKKAPAKAAPKPAVKPWKRVLRLWNIGTDVVRLQRGLGCFPDGIFGPRTQARLRIWQKGNGLTDDGVFGPKSQAKARF